MPKQRIAFAKALAWRLEAAGFDLFTAVARALPIDAVSAVGGALARAIGPLTGAHHTARRGLRLAFPNLPPAEESRLLGAQWENFGRYIFEFPVLDRLTVASGRVELAPVDGLAAIAAAGRPVVFISGHFANLEVMSAAIVQASIDCEITYRAANNPHVDARMRASRRRYGVRLFAPKGGEGGRELLRAMRAGRSVAMMNDQRYDAGVAAPFFGHEVMTNPAAARLALRYGAVIQPMSIQRLKGARFRCVVHEPIVLADTGDRTGDIVAGVVRINAFIEARVRERPGEWWWLHKRWPPSAYSDG